MRTKKEINYGFIYLFTVSGKCYVGQAANLKRRFKKHFSKKNNSYFHNSLRKYFSKNGSFKILEIWKRNGRSLEEFKKLLDSREIFWTAELKTYDPAQKNGWNLTKGGCGQLGFKHKKETKQKIKEHQPDRSGKNNPMFGRSGEKSPSWGKKRPDVSKRIGEKHPMAKFGILISPEGEKFRIRGYTLFCREHNLTSSHIGNVLRGKEKQHKGWTGKYD